MKIYINGGAGMSKMKNSAIERYFTSFLRGKFRQLGIGGSSTPAIFWITRTTWQL